MFKPTPAQARKYSDYSTTVDRAWRTTSVIEEMDDGTYAKFFYRILRIPSRKEFVLRLCPDTTPQEAEYALKTLNSMPDGGWAIFDPEFWFKRRWAAGHYSWHIFGGLRIDDPLIQLELELMIDLTNEVTS
jgi:hypothetical protein